MASTFGAKGLAWIAFREDGSINSPIVKFFSDEEMAALRERMDVEPGDLVMFAAGPRLLSDEILGGMRSHMANALEIKREGHDFLWVVNFPLFHWDEDRKAYAAEHQLHPADRRPTSPRSRPIRWQPVLAPTTLSWTL